jgi:23S rRNA pseudouridine2605 synthase
MNKDKGKPGRSPRSGKNTEGPVRKPADNRLRLNKFIANAGVCSRREADELIADGKITVNGKVVVEMGYKVKPTDLVKYRGKVLKTEKLQYVLLNKPKGFITTMSDEKGRRTVMSLVSKACEERIYPVGRLDRNTTGLLLFTNDGALAKKLTHPSFNVKKIYQVELDRPITAADFEAIRKGIMLEDGLATVDDMAIVSEDGRTLGIEIHIGRNRIVRRIFEQFGYVVQKLDRSMFGALTKKNLPRGKWRHLTEAEVGRLRGKR